MASLDMSQFGAAPAEEPVSLTALGAKPRRGKGIGGDTLTDLKVGFEQIPGTVTGLADVALGALGINGLAGRRLADEGADALGKVTGFQPAEWAKDAQATYSPERQTANANVEEAWNKANSLSDAADVAAAYAKNPRAIAGLVAQNLPQLVPMGAVARVVGKGVQMVAPLAEGLTGEALAKAAANRAIASGAIGEGVVTAGQNMDQTDRTADPTKAAFANLAAGAVTGGIGLGAGQLARATGATTVGNVLGGVKADAAVPLGRRLATGAAEEAGQEFLQSGQEQAWQNYAEGKPLMEGVGRQAVEGALVGGALGAGSNVIPEKPVPPAAEPVPPAAEVAAPTLALPAPVDPVAPPLVVFPDGSTMTQAEAEQHRLNQMVQASDMMPSGPITSALAATSTGPTSVAAAAPTAPEAHAQALYLQAQEKFQAGKVEEGKHLMGQGGSVRQGGTFIPYVPAPTPVAGKAPDTGKLKALQEKLAEAKRKLAEQRASTVASSAPVTQSPQGEDHGQSARTESPLPQSADQGAQQTGLLNGGGEAPTAPGPSPKLAESDEARYQRIKDSPPSQRTDADIAWANAHSKAKQAPTTPEPSSADKSNTDGYAEKAAGENLFRQRLIRDALNATMSFNGELVSRKEGIKSRVEDGWKVGEREGQPALLSPDGSHLLQSQITKTGIEYARHLIAATPLEDAASEAATSPLNDKPEPTPAQIEAGNYAKGHYAWHGLDISIENPRGSLRSGVDPNGDPWSVTMPAHYGYIRGTIGADGEHVDIYLGQQPEAGSVFVVDQADAATGKFDEHKIIGDVASRAEAEKLYDAGFSDGKGPQRRSVMREMSVAEFKDWLDKGDATGVLRISPFSDSQLIIRGETKKNKERIKAVKGGATWNRVAEGWTFPKTREAEYRAALADLLAEPDVAPTSAPKAPEYADVPLLFLKNFMVDYEALRDDGKFIRVSKEDPERAQSAYDVMKSLEGDIDAMKKFLLCIRG